jgi:hypothetical protein
VRASITFSFTSPGGFILQYQNGRPPPRLIWLRCEHGFNNTRVAILLERDDEWAVQRGRTIMLETMAGLSDDPIVKLPAVAA